jgi:hypothetical protein
MYTMSLRNLLILMIIAIIISIIISNNRLKMGQSGVRVPINSLMGQSVNVPGDLIGGDSRATLYSRFFYTPELAMPYISKLTTTPHQDDRLSVIYNRPGRLKLYAGRPYRLYRSNDGSWIYPWNFNRYVRPQCLRQAAIVCREPIVTLIRSEMGKLGGMGVISPKDVIHTSQCFDREFTKCSGET